jgi:hypothetical protein
MKLGILDTNGVLWIRQWNKCIRAKCIYKSAWCSEDCVGFSVSAGGDTYFMNCKHPMMSVDHDSSLKTKIPEMFRGKENES